jgi:hypothetical protein
MTVSTGAFIVVILIGVAAGVASAARRHRQRRGD